jgi:hypothetical protein
MLEAKAKLHFEVKNNPMLLNVESLSESQVCQHAGVSHTTYKRWKENNEHFYAWFINKDSNVQLLESGVHSALQAAINILEDEEVGQKGGPKYSDQIAAAKLVLEYAGYAPVKKTQNTTKAGGLEDLSEDELDSIIKQGLQQQETITRDLAVVGESKSKDN